MHTRSPCGTSSTVNAPSQHPGRFNPPYTCKHVLTEGLCLLQRSHRYPKIGSAAAFYLGRPRPVTGANVDVDFQPMAAGGAHFSPYFACEVSDTRGGVKLRLPSYVCIYQHSRGVLLR